MEDRFVTLLAMAMAATHATFTARTRPTRHAAHRPLLAWCTQHERALPPASHAVAHNTMAPASLWLQFCTQAVILLGCVAVCCRPFLRCIMARILLPLSSLALLSPIFFCCLALHIALCVLLSLHCWLLKSLVRRRTMGCGPHSARMRVAACRRAPHRPCSLQIGCCASLAKNTLALYVGKRGVIRSAGPQR